MRLNLPLLLIFLITHSLVSSGCVVSKKKYQLLESQKKQLEDKLKLSQSSLKDCEDDNDSLKKVIDQRNANIQQDQLTINELDIKLKETIASNKKCKEQYDLLKKKFDDLETDYEQSKNKNSTELKKFLSELETMQKELQDREQKLTDLKNALNERDSIVTVIRNKISDALLSFKDKGITCEIRNGNVYVSLSNQLLFASGSTQIDSKGVDALKQLASVLKLQNDVTIRVEGHTDNVKVTNLGLIKDNWDLSVMRSTEVVRVLTGAGVDPKRVIASGRSQYLPVNSADTPDARAQNRRTEIIIVPNVEELLQVIGQ